MVGTGLEEEVSFEPLLPPFLTRHMKSAGQKLLTMRGHTAQMMMAERVALGIQYSVPVKK